MKGVYTATIKCAGITTAKTLLILENTASKILEVLYGSVTEESTNINQQNVCALHRITTLGTPTGTTVTPAPQERGDQASTITVLGNITASEPTYGADGINEYGREGFSFLNGWVFAPLPEGRLYMEPSGNYGLRLRLAPGSTLDIDVTLQYREIG
jgi:hypothetical protein